MYIVASQLVMGYTYIMYLAHIVWDPGEMQQHANCRAGSLKVKRL